MMTGIANWRDVGARAENGIAPGRVFRSGHLANATAADLVELEQIGLATILDLRRPHERAASPTPALSPGVTILTSDLGDATEPPHVAFLRQAVVTPASVDAYLVDYYTHAAFLPRHIALFQAMFAALLDRDGAMLVHCAAGKDRTGLAIALLQSALGVPRAAILAEYALSNAALARPDALDAARVHLCRVLGQTPPDFAIAAFLGVSAHHLAAAFDGIEQRRGSVEAYLADLGVGARETAALRIALQDRPS
uniref:tyrosine-protein phosphatase n=1 Tax=uncultured Sphingomonas sp. TaxID=158754 RepID=UPI0035C97D67